MDQVIGFTAIFVFSENVCIKRVCVTRCYYQRFSDLHFPLTQKETRSDRKNISREDTARVEITKSPFKTKLYAFIPSSYLPAKVFVFHESKNRMLLY